MKENIVTKKYIGQNDRFADLCNYFLFDGRQVIRPEDLKEKDVTELGIPFTAKGMATVERIRDVLKSCAIKTADGITYLVIGVENQADIHYAMVIRNMVQDALNYAAQVERLAKEHKKRKDLTGDEFLSGISKEDKLAPVITITVYWNSGEWDAPRTLHEMLGEKSEEILRYVPDYRMNLIVPEEIRDFERFHTELGPVMEFLRRSNDVGETKEFIKMNQEQGLYFSRDAVEVLNACVNAGLSLEDAEGGEGNVCKGIQGWLEEERAEGRAEERVSLLLELVKDGLLDLTEAAKRANKTEKEFEKILNNL